MLPGENCVMVPAPIAVNGVTAASPATSAGASLWPPGTSCPASFFADTLPHAASNTTRQYDRICTSAAKISNCGSELDDGADRRAFVHQIERVIDLLEWELVGDQALDLVLVF